MLRGQTSLRPSWVSSKYERRNHTGYQGDKKILMPFSSITSGKDKGKFKSPSGRVFTEKQVKLYEATKFDKSKMAEHNLGKAMKNLHA